MNKLTVEQRDWIIDRIQLEASKVIDGESNLVWLVFRLRNDLDTITANTAEDERLDFRGRLAGETNWQQQQREANTAEDEDDDCYCTDENECHYCLENKSDARWLQEQERQITLRMIEEFIAEFPANKNLTVGFYVNLMKERLQREDE